MRAAALVLVALARPLAAQTIRGTVVDSATATPLASVTIELFRPDSQLVERASTDSAGIFSVQAPEPGRYRLRVQRIGYRPYESSIAVASREVNLPLRISTVPVQLSPVRVEAERDEFLVNRGYYMRKESEAGTFLDPPQVERLASRARVLGDVLEHIPGVTMQVASASGGVRVPHLRGCRRPMGGGGRDAINPVKWGSEFPRMYLDGVEVERAVLSSLLPTDILAVEVYRGPAQIPLQYGGTNTPCGVLLIWTKH